MSLFGTLKTLVSPRAMGDEIVRLQTVACVTARNLYPGSDQHVWLAHAWLSRMAAKGEVNPNDTKSQQTSFRETLTVAMIEWPKCARFLGLAFVASEQPTVLRLVPEYAQEFSELQRTSARFDSNPSLAIAEYVRLNPSMRVETVADGSSVFTSVHQAPKQFKSPLIQRVGEREFMQEARNAVRPHFPASTRKQTTSNCPSCGLPVRFKVADGERVEVDCRNCNYIFDYLGGTGIQRL